MGFAGAAAAVAGDAPPLILQHLTTAEGLPQGTVYSTLQDSQGFVWLATEDGLVRYDGRELLRYAYSPSARGGLPGNFIYQIVEDPHHDLWLAVKDIGVARWNRATDTFTVYRHDPKDPRSLGSDAVRTLLVDARGRIWVGTSDAGIDILDPASGHIDHLRHDPADPASLLDDHVHSLSLDRSGTLWVGTQTGLDRWQPGGGFVHVRHVDGDPRSLSGSQIKRVIEDRRGALWVATYDGGLDRMDRSGRVEAVYRHDPRRSDSLSSDYVHTVLEDQAGNLWVGTSAGLDLLDRASGGFHHYRHDDTDPDSLRDSDILSLYQDPTGLLWIGTRAGGVSRWNPHSWELGASRPAWLHGNYVQAFADGADDTVWIGTMGSGLWQLNPVTGQASSIDTLLGRRDALGDERVMSLHRDRRGTLWIGTMSSGLHALTRDGRLLSFPVKAGDPHAVSAAGIMTIFEARDGRIWLGTFGGGADVLDPATGLIRQLPYGAAPGAVSGANVSAIAEDGHGNLWMATDGEGLNLARPDGTVIRVFHHDANDPGSLPADAVYALAVDAQDRLWLGTDTTGLAEALGTSTAPSLIRFRAASAAEELSSHTIFGVLADEHGFIWASGNAGLVRFDPQTLAVKTYHREDGLQGEEFNFGSYARLRDGRLCFGGPGGFNIFDPARLEQDRPPPHLALTRVEILGVPARLGAPYWQLHRLGLDYRDSIVSLDFSVLDFTSPRRNRIAYRMAGLTDRWIDLGTQNRITLTNLDAGDHVLEVRAANSDSVWSGTPLRLVIHKEPAPWRSGWAYALYALAALALIAARVQMQRARFRRMAREQERLESEVRLRTHELLESNRQLAEAAQAKTRFMDRMSHELRTPMNGVVGMTELLVRTGLSARQGRLADTIRSSAQVLLQIVNDLLDLSKIRSGKVQLEELPVDLAQILDDCAGLFTAAAGAKSVDLIVCPPAAQPQGLLGDPLRLRQILMNLIGNAIKFTSQGEVVVTADLIPGAPGTATLQLAVADTGIGMDAATIGRIFEPFTQADESTTRRFGGSGLGLAICRELAEVMGGTISVESLPQVGSTFRVSLPLKHAAAAQAPAPALAHHRVRILTRRPALAESLARHARALGLAVLEPEGAGSADVVIADAAGLSGRGAPGASAALVVAGAAGIDGGGSAHPPQEHPLALPLRREALSEAICAALGVPTPSAAAAPDATAAVRAHVLLVEDEPVNAEVAQGYLEAIGCTSVWVRSGAEAVARSAAERFDLIL
ncbi:MAG TPA: two-component regulator propeller domain-containing protein, partial [Steroidobacteraceae bacterium]|nr:two-component regulator propeller domain-containing protein [Steroidobacteraceae bacterium]